MASPFLRLWLCLFCVAILVNIFALEAGHDDAGVQNDDPATLIRLNLGTYPKARCLDGSPGAYYVRKQTSGPVSSWVFVLEGGGFCGSPESCTSRSMTDLGSSVQYPAQWHLQEPYLSTSPRDNPLFHDWGIIYLKSCDGAYFAGTAGPTNLSEDVTLHYSGEYVLRAVVDDFASRDHDFKGATHILVAGASAGGIAVLAQLDAIKDMLRRRLNSHVRVHGFADSAFYLAKPRYSDAKRYIVHGHRAGRLLPDSCLRDHAGTDWMCFITEIASAYLRTPVFFWQSRFDTDQLTSSLDPACRQSDSCVDAYGQELMDGVLKAVASVPSSGAFVDACAHHCWGSYAEWRSPVPFTVDGRTPILALSDWYRAIGDKVSAPSLRGRVAPLPFLLVQPGTYPCRGCCEGAGP